MKIAIVDGSRTALRIYCDLLVAAGHQPVPVASGAAALALLREDVSVEVLLTSFELPDMSGLELCWEARLLAEERNPLYIIAMSATREEGAIAKALDSGADDFIAKPPSRTELYARLRSAERLVLAQNELIRIANVDLLTELPNRRSFLARALYAARKADEGDEDLAFVVFDVDHFKAINDGHGHDAGDAVLATLGRIIRASNVPAARIGGEEFAAFAEDVSVTTAVNRVDTLRRTVAATVFDAGGAAPIAVTISIGVAMYQPGEGVPEVMRRADEALYAAKHAGRNRVAVSDEDGLVEVIGQAPPATRRIGA